jgi:dynein heavy chain
MQFPALVNCTSIDWFQPWPSDALLSVGQKYVKEPRYNIQCVARNIYTEKRNVTFCDLTP